MIIKDIQYSQNGQTRTDGRYPTRIGCQVNFAMPIEIGQCMWLGYEKDKNGEPKEGYLRTSAVTGTFDTETDIIVETLNSVYVLTKV